MRKITRASIEAFMAGRRFNSGNMSVSAYASTVHGAVSALFLHGNLIATKRGAGGDYDVVLRDAEWRTVTTKERLNGVCEYLGIGRPIYQHAHDWYFDGEDWHGSVNIEVRGGAVAAIKYMRPRTGDIITLRTAA